jgi:hypothetical protein
MVILFGLARAGLKVARDAVADLDNNRAILVSLVSLKGIGNMLGDRKFHRGLSPVHRHQQPPSPLVLRLGTGPWMNRNAQAETSGSANVAASSR